MLHDPISNHHVPVTSGGARDIVHLAIDAESIRSLITEAKALHWSGKVRSNRLLGDDEMICTVSARIAIPRNDCRDGGGEEHSLRLPMILPLGSSSSKLKARPYDSLDSQAETTSKSMPIATPTETSFRAAPAPPPKYHGESLAGLPVMLDVR